MSNQSIFDATGSRVSEFNSFLVFLTMKILKRKYGQARHLKNDVVFNRDLIDYNI